MPVTAKLKYLRVASRKARLVADLIRKKDVGEAQAILNFTVKRAAKPILKLLKSAIANASHNFHLDPENLYISKVTVDEGPKLKRWMPRARGQASEIQKKTSHITIVLDELEKGGKKRKKMKKMRKEIKEKMEISEPKEKKIAKTEKPKLKTETGRQKPKVEKGIRRFFRRKAF